MKDQIQNIILKAIGEDREIISSSIDSSLMNAHTYGYNQALSETKAKAPAITEAIIELVVEEIEKWHKERGFEYEEITNILKK
jgi:hypothetical protein